MCLYMYYIYAMTNVWHLTQTAKNVSERKSQHMHRNSKGVRSIEVCLVH